MAAAVAVAAVAVAVVAVAVVGDVEACATELGANEMVNDGWVAP